MRPPSCGDSSYQIPGLNLVHIDCYASFPNCTAARVLQARLSLLPQASDHTWRVEEHDIELGKVGLQPKALLAAIKTMETFSLAC